MLILALAAGRQLPLWSAGLGALLWMLGTPVYGVVRLLPGMEWFDMLTKQSNAKADIWVARYGPGSFVTNRDEAAAAGVATA